MISRDENPDFLNSFLDYTITILNKSPNSVKEYNYDIANFLKYMKKPIFLLLFIKWILYSTLFMIPCFFIFVNIFLTFLVNFFIFIVSKKTAIFLWLFFKIFV